jgi:hypothetical protein
VDESADQRYPARSRMSREPAALRLLAASLLHAQSGHSTRRRILGHRWCDYPSFHPQRHELHRSTVCHRDHGRTRSAARRSQRQLNDWRPRASISYVTAGMPPSIGYDGGYFAQTGPTEPTACAWRYVTTRRRWTASTPNPAASTCGTHEPLLASERSVQPSAPAGADASQDQYGPFHIDNRVAYSGFYA